MISQEQMVVMALFASALTKMRAAAEAGTDVTLTNDENLAMIFTIKLWVARENEETNG